MWNKYPNITPPDIPETEDFGVEYEVKYKLPNGCVKSTITEWLWENQCNCIYPVIAWRECKTIIPFSPKSSTLITRSESEKTGRFRERMR